MKLGFRGKLFVVSLTLVLVVGSISAFILEGALRSWLSARLETELLHDAYAMRDLMEVAPDTDTASSIDALADRMSASTEARITVVARDGTVLGDSDLNVAGVLAADNHGTRPEIAAATEHGMGASRRYSTTLRTDMLYVAVPYAGGNGTVRAAMPLSDVDGAVNKLRMLLLFTGMLGLVLAIVMSGLASHLMTRALRRLVASAQKMAQGERREVVAVPASHELEGLAGSFNQLTRDLSSSVLALAEERDRLHWILNGMSEAVVALDETQHVTLANATARDWLNLPQQPSDRPLLGAGRLPALLELLSKAKESPAAAEFDLPGTPLRRVWVHVARLQVSAGAVIVMYDVTERRRMETVRRDFVANVSHELRTPVSVIRANAETLLDEDAFQSPIERDFLEAILRNSERLAQLISDLLDLSRIEAGEQVFNLKPTLLAPVVARATAAAMGHTVKDPITVENLVSGKQTLHADEKALEQVLQNLLDNAVKYTQCGGHIAVRAVRDGDAVRIEVEDDGPGIPAAHRDRVFERFYRVDSGRSREVGGTGLGLAIVKHLVQSMGGTVGLRPGDECGSVFWVRLPGG